MPSSTTLYISTCEPMDDLTVSTGRTSQGLRTVLLENGTLRVVVLPEAGARIRQITYKPLDADLLWNHPSFPAKVTTALHL